MEPSFFARRLLLAAGLAALVALRFVHLDADTPWAIGTGSYGVFVDEGYKTLEAKNRVLFGVPRWNPADGYTGWADTSPLGHAGFRLAFEALGPKLASARFVTVAWTAVFLLSWVLASRGRSFVVALTGLVLLGLQHTLFFFSRTALLELPLIACLYAGVFCLMRRDESPRAAALGLGGAALVAGVGIKPSAMLFFVPVVLGVLVAETLRARRVTRTAGAGVIVAVAVFAAWGILHWDAVAEKLDPPSLASLRLVLLNPLSFASGPLIAAALWGLAWALRHDPRRFLAHPYRASLVALALVGPWLFLPFGYAPLRYHVPLLPAFVLLALETWRFGPRDDERAPRVPTWASALALVALAWGLVYFAHTIDQQILRRLPIAIFDPDVRAGASVRLVVYALPLALVVGAALWRAAGRLEERAAHAATAALLVVSLGHDLYRIGDFFLHPVHEVIEITAGIDEHLPPEATVAGDWAPLFTLDSGRRSLYLAVPDNAPERLDELRPDAFLDADTLDDRAARAILTAPGADPRLGPPLYTATYGKREIVLYGLVNHSLVNHSLVNR